MLHPHDLFQDVLTYFSMYLIVTWFWNSCQFYNFYKLPNIPSLNGFVSFVSDVVKPDSDTELLIFLSRSE